MLFVVQSLETGLVAFVLEIWEIISIKLKYDSEHIIILCYTYNSVWRYKKNLQTELTKFYAKWIFPMMGKSKFNINNSMG